MAKLIAASAWESDIISQKQPSMALSESEINAAMQLIQLSIADSYSDHTDLQQEEEEEDRYHSDNSFLSFSVQQEKPNLPSKVDNSEGDAASSMSATSTKAEEEEEDGDDDRRSFGVRRNKRYRSVAELYRVTDETVAMSVVKANKRKKKEMNCL